MTAQPYHQKLARVLDRMGAVYTVSDILAAIAEGKMQSFAYRNSWLIAQVNRLPRATVMDWLAVVGDLDDCRVLHDQAIDFAREHDIGLIRAYGRRGWMPDARERGWRPITTNVVYHKEL